MGPSKPSSWRSQSSGEGTSSGSTLVGGSHPELCHGCRGTFERYTPVLVPLEYSLQDLVAATFSLMSMVHFRAVLDSINIDHQRWTLKHDPRSLRLHHLVLLRLLLRLIDSLFLHHELKGCNRRSFEHNNGCTKLQETIRLSLDKVREYVSRTFHDESTASISYQPTAVETHVWNVVYSFRAVCEVRNNAHGNAGNTIATQKFLHHTEQMLSRDIDNIDKLIAPKPPAIGRNPTQPRGLGTYVPPKTSRATSSIFTSLVVGPSKPFEVEERDSIVNLRTAAQQPSKLKRP